MQAIFKSFVIIGPRPQRLLKNREVRSCWKWTINKDDLSMRITNIHSMNFCRTLCSNINYNPTQTWEKHFSHSSIIPYSNNVILHRSFGHSSILFDKASSKIEETVQSMKDQKASDSETPKQIAVKKKPIMQRIKDELLHYYHGFRLLGVDINISRKLLWRVLNGKQLTRREYNLLLRTTGDVFRLIPFSVFIIVPFMEFLLPVAIKLFPGMLPSTFETSSEKETKNRKSLKVKLEMAKFLQQTLDQMAPQASDRHSDLAGEFKEFFVRVRNTGELATNEEILKFSKLFEDEITLDSLQRPQLIALCRVLEVSAIGTNPMLRFNLRMKLRTLAVDDKMIAKEGVETLTLNELQSACRARGMRAYGMLEDRLRLQLNHWLDLSLNKKVPPSLLLLSRALMIPENVPTSDKLKATISALPENIVKTTTAAIVEKEGKIDNKAKIEALKEEVRKVLEEREEIKQIEKSEKETLVDKAQVLSATKTPELEDKAPIITPDTGTKTASKPEEGISSKDMELIEDALETIAKEKKKLLVEKEEIKDLKDEMADYQEDVQELQEMVKKEKAKIRETKGAKRLSKMVNSMITSMDKVLGNLEGKELELKQNLAKKVEAAAASEGQDDTTATKEQLVHVNELVKAIKKIRNVPNDSKVEKFQEILHSMDDDFDGQLKVDDLLKVIETIGKDEVNLTGKQVSEIIELLDKEEMFDVEEKIQKALDKGAQQETENTSDSEKKQSPPTKPVATKENSNEKISLADSVVQTDKKVPDFKPLTATGPDKMVPPIAETDKKKPTEGKTV